MQYLDFSLGNRLAELEEAQLVRPAMDGESTYQFKHALIQEVAYQSLLKMTRADLHRRVAEVIEQLWPDQLDPNAGLLAWHYERAGSTQKAFHYAIRAGDWAARAFAHVEALTYYDRVVALASSFLVQDSKPDWTRQVGPVFVRKGRVLEVMGNHAAAVENYRAMIEYAQRTGDAALEADGLNHLVTAQVVLSGPTPETDKQLERVLTLAQHVQDPELIARALWNRGLAHRLTDPQRAAADFVQALELADKENLHQVAAFVRMDLSLALVLLARAHQAQGYLKQALDAFRSLDLKPMMADALGTMAYHAYTRGELAPARAFAEEGLAISQRIENPWGVLYNQMLCVFIFELERGHLARVLGESESYLARAKRFGYPYFVVMHHAILTRAHLELNHLADAQAWTSALAKAFGMEASPLGIWARWLQALILIRRGELRRAHELLAPTALKKGFSLGPLDFSGWLDQTHAELALLEGRPDEGIELCDRRIRGFEQEEQYGFAAGMYYWRARLHFARGDLQHAEEDALRARERLEQAEHRILLWHAEAVLGEIYATQGRETERREADEREGATFKYIQEHSR